MILIKRSLFYLIIIILFSSCGTWFQGPRKSQLKKIDQSFSGAFYNTPFKTRGNTSHQSTLLSLLDITNYGRVDTVHLTITPEAYLSVTFKDGSQPSKILLQGKFKKGYYEYFLSNKRTGIPLINRKTDVNRIRIGLTKDNLLMIDNYWDNGATRWVLFASGSSGRGQYYFKKINF